MRVTGRWRNGPPILSCCRAQPEGPGLSAAMSGSVCSDLPLGKQAPLLYPDPQKEFPSWRHG